MYNQVKAIVDASHHIVIIQAENPDGDSLGSSLALEEMLGDMGKQVTLYCRVNMPHYLGYLPGWDRVVDELPRNFDASIIVDTASAALLEKSIVPENRALIGAKPCIVVDHHITEGDLPFAHEAITDPTSVATGELLYRIATELGWPVNPQAAEHLVASIMADSLGLTTENTTPASIRTVADLADKGARIAAIENRRREFMKKSPEILNYKGQLLQRIEYHLDGALALIHIPWSEISEYSDQYNPSMLVIDEARLVQGVRLAIAIKTYPDGKITGKIRCNPGTKVAETVAKYFGGGGHGYVAGFKTYEKNYEAVKHELIGTVDKILQDFDTNQS